MRCALLFLVPALALSACGSMTQADYQSLSRSLSQSNAQMQQYQAQNQAVIQQGQQSMSNLQPYSYQRTDGVWVYCNQTSSYTVSCRTN